MGNFTTDGNYQASATINGKTVSVDPRVTDILKTAAAISNYNVEAFSAVAPRASGTPNHPGGYATDIYLVDPSTGARLTNYAGSAFAGNGTVAQNFPAYERFAQTARIIQQQKYPELNGTFRWGGYFPAGNGNSAGPDMMHFDITPSAHGAMPGGSWDMGGYPGFLKTYGLASNGGIAGNPSLLSQIKTQYADLSSGVAPGAAPVGDWAAAFANLPPKNSALSAIDANTVPLPPSRPQDIPPPLPIPRPNIGTNAGDSLAFNPGPLSGTATLNANNANYPAMDAGYDPVTGLVRQYANPLGNFPARPAVIAPNGSVPSTYAPGQVGQVPSQPSGASLPSSFPSRPSVVGGNGLSTGTSSMAMNDPNYRAVPDQITSPSDAAAFYAAFGIPPSLGPSGSGTSTMAMNDLPKPISVAGGATALPAGGGMGSGVASLAPQPLPASARPAPPTNAKGYVIGQTYTDKSGYQYQANADGSFTKVANPYRAPTAIQTLFEAAKPGVMGTAGTLVNDAMNFGPSTVNAAQGLGSSVASAASGVGSLLGNLFHPPASVAPAPSYDPPLAYSSSGSGSSGSSYHAPPVSQTPSSAYNPVPLAPLSSTFPSRPSYPSPNNVPATIQQRYLNPAYVAPSSGISATGSAYGGIGEGGFASGSINMSGAPMLKSAAQAAAPQYLYRTVPNPAWSPSPVTPAYLTPAQLAALRAGANPYANWKGPVGDVMNFLHGQPGGGLLGLLGGNNPQHNGLAGLFGGGSSGGGSPAARTGTGLAGAGYTPVSNGSGGYTNTAGDQTYVPSAGGYIATGGSGDRYSGDPGFQASDGSWY